MRRGEACRHAKPKDPYRDCLVEATLQMASGQVANVLRLDADGLVRVEECGPPVCVLDVGGKPTHFRCPCHGDAGEVPWHKMVLVSKCCATPRSPLLDEVVAPTWLSLALAVCKWPTPQSPMAPAGMMGTKV
eukprot:3165795-Amphidinium_carterae.2